MKKLKLYSLATPNGQKVSIALKEMQLEFEAHKIDITKDEQFSESFIDINPNSKIPALVDEGHPDGELKLFESGAILLYLAEKTKMFLSENSLERHNTLKWLFFQMGGVGPMFGQFGHFYKYAKDKCKDEYPLKRYTNETKRLLKVIDQQLEKSAFIATNNYSIADMAIYPWIVCLDKFYNATDVLELKKFKHINSWAEKISERPLTEEGMRVCEF